MKNNMFKTAVEFLLYSYFNLSFDDKDNIDLIIKNVVKKAQADALSQGAYYTLVTDKEESDKAIKKAKKYLFDTMKVILDNKQKYESFFEFHKSVCFKLVGCFSDVNEEKILFSYGNAQKWLNMSIKYLCLINSVFKEFDIDSEFVRCYQSYLSDNEDNFDVPVDSFILDYIWNKTEVDAEKIPGYGDNFLKNSSRKNYKKPSDYLKKWSKWGDQKGDNEDKEYSEFQKALKASVVKDESPIIWENRAWIYQARKRRDS